MPKPVKTITSYSGLARFLAEASETGEKLPSSDFKDVPSPYRYSPDVTVYSFKGRRVVWFETAHKRYEVYAVSDFIKEAA
jgi:hypothetical protein